MIEFSSFLSKRFYKWKQFLTTATDRAGRIQYDEDENIYLIYFYDGPEVFWTRIWKSTVPSDIEISDSYPDSENTEDKAEFLTLITFFNQSNIPKQQKVWLDLLRQRDWVDLLQIQITIQKNQIQTKLFRYMPMEKVLLLQEDMPLQMKVLLEKILVAKN